MSIRTAEYYCQNYIFLSFVVLVILVRQTLNCRGRLKLFNVLFGLCDVICETVRDFMDKTTEDQLCTKESSARFSDTEGVPIVSVRVYGYSLNILFSRLWLHGYTSTDIHLQSVLRLRYVDLDEPNFESRWPCPTHSKSISHLKRPWKATLQSNAFLLHLFVVIVALIRGCRGQ